MDDFSRRVPEVHSHAFVAPGAHLVGRVVLGEGASVWYNAVLRADIEDILIGENSNIQDNGTIHVDYDRRTIIGAGVTVGHGAILHACTVEDHCLVGMGAILLDGCVIPRNSMVAAGSLVSPNKVFSEGSLILGSPARAVRKLSEEEIRRIRESAAEYRRFWEGQVRQGIGRRSG